MTAVVKPISYELPLEMVGVPDLGIASKQMLESASKEVEEHKDWYDGDILLVPFRGLAGKTLSVFPATFSWSIAGSKTANQGAMLGALGSLGVAIFLYNEKGQLLWQLRSHQVVGDGLWGCSVCGYVTPEQTIRQAMEAELEEELGLQVAEVANLHPIALVHLENTFEVTVAYRGMLSSESILRPGCAEVEDLLWSLADQKPGKAVGSAEVMLEVLQPLLAVP